MSDPIEQAPLTEEQVNKILEQEPEVFRASLRLNKAIDEYLQTQQFIITQREKGLVVPNLEQRTHTAQRNLAMTIDQLTVALEGAENIQVKQIAIGVLQHGLMYFQGIFTSIHYTRMLMQQDSSRPYERLLHEAYALMERAIKKSGAPG